jgi:tetratricopeptide (TPR) repeat protein
MKNLFQPDLLIRLLVPLLLIPLLGISTRPHVVERFLREGKHGQIYGSYLSASLNLSQAANFYYWRAELWEMAGMLAVKAGDYEAAVRYLDKASGQGSLSPRAQIALGDALYENQDIEAAILIWEKALESGVDPAEITNRLTKAHLKSRDYSTAFSSGLFDTSSSSGYSINRPRSETPPQYQYRPLIRGARLYLYCSRANTCFFG